MVTVNRRIGIYVAWPYANGPLHVGHIGGSLLPPDIFARYHRLCGHDVMMVSGSDTHGTPIAVRAEEEGSTPAEVYRRWHADFLETFQQLGITFDLFTHTDTPNHHRVAKDLFQVLEANGRLFVAKDEQLYDPSEGRYLPDRFVEGTCPHCGYEAARGDQCDHCGRLLNASELIEPHARSGSGAALEIHERDHYFLDLPQFSEPLAAWLEAQEGWRAAVRNQSLGQIREGLEPRPITRDLDWGISVPVDGWEEKVLYVWFEAVMGYLSASIEHAARSEAPDRWRDFWYGDDAEAYYFMGKDNITFHAVMWPAILMGAERYAPDERAGTLLLPTDVVANEFVNLEGAGMSTSRNWAVWILDYLERYDPDPLRYYLTINAPETRDVDFSWADFVRANNNELLATWGNLVNRVLKLTISRCDGRVPEPGPLDEVDRAVLDQVQSAFETVAERIEARRFKVALADAMAVAHDVNRYLNEKAPWKQLKTDPTAGQTTLYVALRAIDDLKILLAPFLPHTSEKVHRYLGYDGRLFGTSVVQTVEDGGQSYPVLRYADDDAVGRWAPGELPPGQALREPEPLVVKLDEAVAAAEIERLEADAEPVAEEGSQP